HVKDVDRRADLYALGVAFYFAVTGVHPLSEFSSTELHSTRAHERILAPDVIVKTLHEPVKRVLGKLLEKDRDRRYASAVLLEELAEDAHHGLGQRLHD